MDALLNFITSLPDTSITLIIISVVILITIVILKLDNNKLFILLKQLINKIPDLSTISIPFITKKVKEPALDESSTVDENVAQNERIKEISEALSSASDYRIKGQFCKSKPLYSALIEKVNDFIKSTASPSPADNLVLANAFLDSAHDYQNRGDFDNAAINYNKAIERSDEGDKTSLSFKAHAMIGKGFIKYSKGANKDAKDEFDKAAKIFSTLQENLGMAGAYKGKAKIAYVMGEHSEALTYFEKAKKEYMSYQDKIGEAYIRLNMGTVHLAKGDEDEAKSEFEIAEKIFMQECNVRGLASSVLNFATLDLSQHKIFEAIGELRTAKVYFKYLNSKLDEANACFLIGKSFTELPSINIDIEKQRDEAKKSLRQAQKLYNEMGAPMGLASVNYIFGKIELQVYNYSQATGFFQSAIEDSPENNNKATALSSLGDICFIQNELDEAKRYFSQSLEIFTRTESCLGISKLKRKLAYVAIVEQEFQRCEDYLNESIAILKLNHLEEQALNKLYLLLLLIEKHESKPDEVKLIESEFKTEMQKINTCLHLALKQYLWGKFYLLQSNYFLANEHLSDARTRFEITKQDSWFVRCCYALAINVLSNSNDEIEKRNENAMFFLKKGFDTANKLEFKLAIEKLQKLKSEIESSD